jgi:drug/metabolite transporter (DMT)-like permease
MRQKSRALVYALSAIGFWSTMATAFKISLRYLSSVELLVLSSFFSLLFLLVVLLVQGKITHLRITSGLDFARSAVLGLFNPFLYYIVLLAAYSRLLGQEALVLNYVWPIVLVLLSAVLLRQRLTPKTVLALLLSFCGVILIATRGEWRSLRFSDPLGIAMALGSSIFWALFWIFNVKDKRDEVVKICLNMFFGFVYSFLVLLLTEGIRIPPLPGWLGTVYVGLFEMGLTFVLWLKALRLAPSAALISNLVFLSPFVSLLLLHLIVGESIYLSTFIGLILIVGGILLQRWRSAP